MGILTKTRERMFPLKEGVSSTVPTWQAGMPQAPQWNYQTAAKEGFTKNELVYAATMEIATSAAEPPLVAYQRTADGLDPLPDQNPLVQLLHNPNPYMSQYEMWADLMVDLCIAGNGYIEKVRSKSGKVVEMWLMRPDFVKVIPGGDYIAGYQYLEPGAEAKLPAEDVIHIKFGRNPMDKWYGMGPLQVAAGWTDIDTWMRTFVKAFFQNAGVPSGILTTTKNLSQDEKRLLRESWRGEFSGPGGWNKVAVFDGAASDTKYTPMGLPLGGRGLVLPDLEEIATSRLASAFRVPVSILGVRLGMHSSSYANREADLHWFWTQTLAPIYKRNADALNRDLVPEFQGVDSVAFDLQKVQALVEDQDKIHARWRGDFQVGAIGIGEFRSKIGMDPELPPDDVFLIPFNTTPTPSSEVDAPPPPKPVPDQLQQPPEPKGWERLPAKESVPQVIVNMPKPVKSRKKVKRDKDGQIDATEEEFTYAD